jgi:hypothetical protein
MSVMGTNRCEGRFPSFSRSKARGGDFDEMPASDEK